jgi:competence protein ComEC
VKFKFLKKLVSFDQRFPAALFLLSLVAGQILALWWSSVIVIAVLYGVIQLLFHQWGFIAVGRLHNRLYLGILLGVIGVRVLLPSSDFKGVFSQNSYLVKVDDSPRRRRVGEIQVPVRLLAEVRSKENLLNRDGREAMVRPIQNKVRYLCRGIDLPWRNINKVRAGDTLIIRGVFEGLKRDSIFSYSAYLKRQGFWGSCKIQFASLAVATDISWVQRVRTLIKKEVERVVGVGEISGLTLSTSLGIKDVLSDSTENNFRLTGLSHVLVVSGYQVTLVYGAVIGLVSTFLGRIFWLVRRVPIFYLSIPIGMIVTGLFVLLVEPDGPVLRAWLALLLAGVLKMMGRDVGGANLLIIGLLSMAVVSPGCYLDPGVELSFAALAGLQIGDFLGKGQWGKFLWSSVVASTLTGFVSAVRFGGFSLTSLLINPWFAPFLSVIGCKLVIIALLLLFLGIDQKGVVLQGISEALLFSKQLVGWFATLKFGYFEGLSGIILASSLLLLATWCISKRFRPIPNPELQPKLS